VVAEITGAGISGPRALEITNAINLGMAKVFPVVLATGVVIALVDARRIFRARTAASVQPKGAVSAAARAI